MPNKMGVVDETCVCGNDLLKLRMLTEVLRFRSACRLMKALKELTEGELPGESQGARGLMTGVIFEGLQSATRHSAAESDSRQWVHPVLDVHREATVCEVKPTSNASSVTLYTLKAVELTKGCVWGRLHDGSDGGDNATCTVPLSDLKLVEKASFFHDELIPTVECIEPQCASKSALNWFLEKLCGASAKLLSSFNQKRRQAWALTDRLTILFYEERRLLAGLKERLRQEEESALELKDVIFVQDKIFSDMMDLEVHICDKTDDGWFREACSEVNMNKNNSCDVIITLEIHAEHVARLRRLAACSEPKHFGFALALMLLRYAGLSGGEWELESGWHAGIPASVFDTLVDVFKVKVECFASPLNCTLPRYFSAFPDTDAFFGCCGNFFSLRPLPGLEEGSLSLEANPPFNHEVIAASLSRALQCLEDTPQTIPLSFVFILPDSAQAKGVAVRQEAERSRFFRGDCVILPHKSMYVDGARHMDSQKRGKKRQRSSLSTNEEKMVVLSCPTRLLVLQNDAAAGKLSATEGIQKVRSAWEALSGSVL